MSEKLSDMKPWQKILFIAAVWVMVSFYRHDTATEYRQHCRAAIAAKETAYEIKYACRYTPNPEKESWWVDWTPFGAHSHE
jgi:hypothetical protein